MNILCLIILFPLVSFLILLLFRDILPYRLVIFFGVSSIFLSTSTIILLRLYFIKNKMSIIYQHLWSWFDLEKSQISFNLMLDDLSFLFTMMILCIALLVYIFSIWYMQNKENNVLFFALINLFIFNMIFLVLSDNLITMYLGWEGVSICSYLLINFYFYKKYVNLSAMKSLIVTKVSDIFLMIGILLFYINYHTLSFYKIKLLIQLHVIQHTNILNYINLLLLIGLIGKSAQIPLQIWLPKAMVGPTPVSALIHAATMVTAGVYFITRNHSLFILTPIVLYIIGLIGGITLIFGSFNAIFEKDIKKILAYSTMSQIGYVFIALSIGAWNAAIVHLITHAIFKALLFLSTGSLILQCNNQKNIFLMGNQLYKKFYFLYYCFLIGSSSLSAIPIITSGFYSKGEILFNIYNSNNSLFFTIAILSSFLTSLYIFRLFFVVFHTQSNISNSNYNFSYLQYIPLIILLILSTFIGKYIIPDIHYTFPQRNFENSHSKFYLELFASFIILLGVITTYCIYFLKFKCISQLIESKFSRIFLNLFHVISLDNIYQIFLINPYLKIVNLLFHIRNITIIHFMLWIMKKINFLLLYIEGKLINFYILIILISIICITCMITFSSVYMK